MLRILADLGIDEKDGAERILEVWNKIDRLEPEAREALVQKAGTQPNVMAVSAISGEGVDALLAEINRRLSGVLVDRDVIVPVMQLQLLPWIYDHSIVDAREDLEDGNVRLELRLTETEAAELDRRLGIGQKPAREDWER